MLKMCSDNYNNIFDMNIYNLQMRNWSILWNKSYLCRCKLIISKNAQGKYSDISYPIDKKLAKENNAYKFSTNSILAEVPDAVLGRTIKMVFTGIRSEIFRYVAVRKDVEIDDLAKFMVIHFTNESYNENKEYPWVDNLIRSMITSNIFTFVIAPE